MPSGIYKHTEKQLENFRRNPQFRKIKALRLKCDCGKNACAFFRSEPKCRQCYWKIKSKRIERRKK